MDFVPLDASPRPRATFATIGTLGCPAAMPFSMAVNRHGVAWVVSENDDLYRVSTDTAACQIVKRYTPGQDGFELFGMGFVAGLASPDAGFDAGEAGAGIDQLFVASYAGDASTGNSQLGIIDTTSFVLTNLGAFHPESLYGVELTGTGDGRLFAYYEASGAIPPYGMAQIDPGTAAVLNEWPVPVAQGDAWAFAFWGGDFYLFTSGNDMAASEVHRFRAIGWVGDARGDERAGANHRRGGGLDVCAGEVIVRRPAFRSKSGERHGLGPCLLPLVAPWFADEEERGGRDRGLHGRVLGLRGPGLVRLAHGAAGGDRGGGVGGCRTGPVPHARDVRGDRRGGGGGGRDRGDAPHRHNRPDVPVINPCPDADATLIYVIGTSGTLYSFNPASSTFATIGTINCPGAGGSTPFSMAVD